MFPSIRSLVVVGLLTGLSCVSLSAQNVVMTGAISGRVTDPSGALVPGATVVLQNLKTAVKQSSETNHTGLYGFPALPPGSYSVTASLKGFRDVQCVVQVLVGNTTSQDLRLQLGVGGDKVSVTGTAPLLRPTESSASTVMERSFID